VTRDDLALSSDGVVALRVLHLALLSGAPWQPGANILSFGAQRLGLRARGVDDVERILWDPCAAGLVSREWEDETPARAGRIFFRCEPLGFEVLVLVLVMQAPQRRRRRWRLALALASRPLGMEAPAVSRPPDPADQARVSVTRREPDRSREISQRQWPSGGQPCQIGDCRGAVAQRSARTRHGRRTRRHRERPLLEAADKWKEVN
jgi:hypothetical protein